VAADRHQAHAAGHLVDFGIRKLYSEVHGLWVKVVDYDFTFGLDRHFVLVDNFDFEGSLDRYYSWVLNIEFVVFITIH
jgi:hypothetical protein